MNNNNDKSSSRSRLRRCRRWRLVVALVVLAGIAVNRITNFQDTTEQTVIQHVQDGGFTGMTVETLNTTTNQVCHQLLLGNPHTSALALWTHNLNRIHKASRLPPDTEYEYHDLAAQLLHLTSPRLPNSIKAIPRDFSAIDHVVTHVVLPRWNYILASSTNSTTTTIPATTTIPRPVKIVILGGSVVGGMNCLQVFANKVSHKLTRQQCAWPYRLEQFLDQLIVNFLDTKNPQHSASLKLFDVHTVAMGGSNTLSGNAILEFDLLPPAAKNPDIIIHAYATNDMHIHMLHQAGTTTSTNSHDDRKNGDNPQQQQQQGSWRSAILTVLQDFIRLAHNSVVQDCQSPPSSTTTPTGPKDRQARLVPPIVMHLDDYLGNEQLEILATTELSQAVQVLANYYGTFSSLSYAEVVRDWVYGDTHEFWFSPRGWYPPYKQQQNRDKMAREIHPGMPMHMVVAWIIAYHLLTLLTTYCDRQVYAHELPLSLQQQQQQQQQQRQPFDTLPKAKTILEDEYHVARHDRGLPLPDLRGIIRFPGKPKVTPYSLPPQLVPDLTLQDVSALWRNHTITAEQVLNDNNVDCTLPKTLPKCPIAWVSGLLSDHNRLDESGVEEYFKHASLQYDNHGWQIRRHVDGKKMGFVPILEQPGANLTMIFGGGKGALRFPIRQVVVFYLKSYGEKWDQSRIQIRLDRQSLSRSSAWKPALPVQYLEGVHAKQTSEMYIERMVLQQPIEIEDRLRLEVTFVRGKQFKIMGLLICR